MLLGLPGVRASAGFGADGRGAGEVNPSDMCNRLVLFGFLMCTAVLG